MITIQKPCVKFASEIVFFLHKLFFFYSTFTYTSEFVAKQETHDDDGPERLLNYTPTHTFKKKRTSTSFSVFYVDKFKNVSHIFFVTNFTNAKKTLPI